MELSGLDVNLFEVDYLERLFSSQTPVATRMISDFFCIL